MKVRKMSTAVAILTASMLLSSCNILPKEQEYTTATLVAIDDVEYEYEYAYVLRGTLAHTEKVVCSYSAAYSEDYSFDIGGELYGTIYVQPGENVKKGDLLAELDISDYSKSIEAAEDEIGILEENAESYEAQAELAGKRQEILLDEKSDIGRMTMDSAEYIVAEYQENISLTKMRIKILEGWLNYWQTEVEKRRIYAGFDGTVSYIKKVSSGNKSFAGAKVISVSDDSVALFMASTSYADYFTYGMDMTVTVDKTDFSVKVADPSEYGLKPLDDEVYFKIISPSYGLSAGDKGTTTITIERHEDVLYIPEDAVDTFDGQTVVFYKNNDGVYDYKKITTGFSADGYIEVIDGLSEGESLIIG